MDSIQLLVLEKYFERLTQVKTLFIFQKQSEDFLEFQLWSAHFIQNDNTGLMIDDVNNLLTCSDEHQQRLAHTYILRLADARK